MKQSVQDAVDELEDFFTAETAEDMGNFASTGWETSATGEALYMTNATKKQIEAMRKHIETLVKEIKG